MRRFLSVWGFIGFLILTLGFYAPYVHAQNTPQAVTQEDAHPVSVESTLPAVTISETNTHIVAPHPWAIGFQESASPVAERMTKFHNGVLILITFIVLFVSALLLYVMIRFNEKANPVPSKTTHNVKLEVLWTLIPTLILLVMAFPSMSLLFYMDKAKSPEMSLKITGYQWYWGYQYPEHDNLEFTSVMVPEKDLKPDQTRLLSVDQPVVLPVDTDIKLLVTAADVLHAFAMPAFGVKTDAVPGRTNESWVRITKPGIYYGQCSELCGKDHAFMPIEVHAVTKPQFNAWIAAKKVEKDGGIEAKSPYQQISVTQ